MTPLPSPTSVNAVQKLLSDPKIVGSLVMDLEFAINDASTAPTKLVEQTSELTKSSNSVSLAIGACPNIMDLPIQQARPRDPASKYKTRKRVRNILPRTYPSILLVLIAKAKQKLNKNQNYQRAS